ncbi:MAG: hypothetical protein JW818_19835 [Pirellulales bacterium]|nr:hypothetical protein [Pirellulales bacterium]
MVQTSSPTAVPASRIPLDSVTGQLVLQIRGSSRDGQIVRLGSPKCTIGSHRLCTLRLSARGVQPVHCLIVRGSKQTVIRRWSPDTLLNGRAFSDAPLNVGDRLTVGPIDFEVLQTTGGSCPTQSPESQKSENFPKSSQLSKHLADQLQTARRQGRERARWVIGQLRQVQTELAKLQEEQKKNKAIQGTQLGTQKEETRQADSQLEVRRRELAARQEAFEKDLARWRKEQADAQGESARAAKQHQAERREWEALRDEQQRDQDRWRHDREVQETAIQKRETSLQKREAELAAREVSLKSAQAELEKQLRQSQQQRETLDRQAKEQAKEIEDLRRRADARQGESQTASAQAASKLEAERTELDARRRQFAEEREEWRKQSQTQESQLRQLQMDLDAREARSEKQQRELDTRLQRFETDRVELDKERKAFEQLRDQWQADQDNVSTTQTGELEAQQTELDDHRREFEQEQAQWRNQSQAQETRLAQLQADLDARLQEHETQMRELQIQREAFERLQTEWTAQRETQEAELAEREEMLAQRETEWEERASAEDDEPLVAVTALPEDTSPPVDASSVLSRLGVTPLLPDDELESLADEPSRPAAAEPSPSPSTSRPASRSSDSEDESIEDYMARLMQRVRSVAPESDQPKSAADPGTSPQPVPTTPTAAEPEPAEAVKKAPRPKVKEDPNQLMAMRALASATASSAIDQHATNMLRRSTYEKLGVAAIALLCGAGMLTAWSLLGLNNVIYFAGLVCILVAVAWGIQYVILTGRLVIKTKRKKREVQSEEEAYLQEHPEPMQETTLQPSDAPDAPLA